MKSKHKIKKSADRPVTQKMLYAVRSELKHQMTTDKLELKTDIKISEVMLGGKINALDGKVNTLDGKINALDGKVTSHDAHFLSIESKLEKVLTALDHMRVDIEEQRRDNKIVIDGYANLHERVARIEAKEA